MNLGPHASFILAAYGAAVADRRHADRLGRARPSHGRRARSAISKTRGVTRRSDTPGEATTMSDRDPTPPGAPAPAVCPMLPLAHLSRAGGPVPFSPRRRRSLAGALRADRPAGAGRPCCRRCPGLERDGKPVPGPHPARFTGAVTRAQCVGVLVHALPRPRCRSCSISPPTSASTWSASTTSRPARQCAPLPRPLRQSVRRRRRRSQPPRLDRMGRLRRARDLRDRPRRPHRLQADRRDHRSGISTTVLKPQIEKALAAPSS